MKTRKKDKNIKIYTSLKKKTKKNIRKKLKEIKEKFHKYKSLLDAAAKATNCLVTGEYGHSSIHKSMEYLALATDADRVSIFEHFRDPVTGERLISQKYEWSRDSVMPQIGNPALQNLPADQCFPGWLDKTEAGKAVSEIVRFQCPSIRSILKPQCILSILIVPILIEGKLWGSIGFDDCHNERIWDESEIGILFAVAGTIGVAIVRKKAEEEKEKAEIQLRQVQKMNAIGTLAGGIAHDFNNILAAIMGYTELSLEKLPEKSPLRHNLNHILTGCNRAKKLIEQIITFSRQKPQERKPINIIPIIKETLNFLRAILPTTITIKYNIPVKYAIIMGDATEIYQILINLSTNASQAIGEHHGVIEVNLKELKVTVNNSARYNNLDPGEYISLQVCDNGCGIEQKILDRIFEPFFTTKKPGEGSGLGLSVVYGIVKSIGGTISVKSTSDKGSKFQVIFPRLHQKITFTKELQKPVFTGNENILFVDDEKELLGVEHKVLKKLGYKVKSINHSLKALELFKKNPGDFDLLITDYTMPEMTGMVLAEEILKIRPEIPVIICTGYSELLDKEKAINLGVREILLKPVTITDLARAIRRVLSGDRDGGRETGDGRRETGDGRRETGDGRRETGDGRVMS